MPNPHEYLLQEFKISIDKLVPLTPAQVIKEAKALYADLSGSDTVTEQQIRQALILIGRKEFPYRKAYEALCATDEEQRLQEEVLKRLDPAVAEKLKKVTDHGVHVLDYVNSKLFDRDLEATEKYQERQEKFDTLVKQWEVYEQRLQAMIDQLRGLAERAPDNAAEILAKADQFEEGWSIVEKDPDEEEIKHEIETWMTMVEAADGEF
jgi:hypothetical protein